MLTNRRAFQLSRSFSICSCSFSQIAAYTWTLSLVAIPLLLRKIPFIVLWKWPINWMRFTTIVASRIIILPSSHLPVKIVRMYWFWRIPCLNAAAQRKRNFLRRPTIMQSIAFVSAFVCWRSVGQMETRFFQSIAFFFQLKFSSRFVKAISCSAKNVIPYPMMPWQPIQLWFLHAIWCFRWKVGNPTISGR